MKFIFVIIFLMSLTGLVGAITPTNSETFDRYAEALYTGKIPTVIFYENAPVVINGINYTIRIPVSAPATFDAQAMTHGGTIAPSRPAPCPECDACIAENLEDAMLLGRNILRDCGNTRVVTVFEREPFSGNAARINESEYSQYLISGDSKQFAAYNVQNGSASDQISTVLISPGGDYLTVAYHGGDNHTARIYPTVGDESLPRNDDDRTKILKTITHLSMYGVDNWTSFWHDAAIDDWMAIPGYHFSFEPV